MGIFMKLTIVLSSLFSSVCYYTDAVSSCPSKCECKRGWYWTVILTCHNRSSIPENIPARTLKLLFAENKIQLVKPGMFKGLVALNEIQLQGNKIRSIEKGVFDGVENLRFLNMSWNTIETIEPGSFNKTENLEILDLSYNAIKVLRKNTFVGSIWLSHLYLSNNRIETMEPGTFTGLQTLRILHLVYNNLKHLQYGVFKGMSSLYQLDLRMNSIEYIDDGVFEDQKKLDNLYLKSNKIRMVRSATFRGLHSLNSLELSKNNITILYNGTFNETKVLYSLFLGVNQIEEIQSDASEGLQYLEIFELDKTRLKSIGANLFHNMPKIVYLSMVGNYFETLEEGTFKGLKNLHVVFLKNNMLTWLPGKIFNDSKDTEQIQLQENKLRTIEQGTFEGMVKLKTLNLSHNQLEWIRGHEFLTLRSLGRLDLNTNKLKSIEPGSFRDLQQLFHLFLKNNNLPILPDGLFTKMKTLLRLDISNSNIEEMIPGTFRELTTLKYLILKRNKITKLRGGIFNGTRNLAELDLSDNAINIIEGNAFDDMKMLTELSLQNNNISYIQKGVLSILPEVTSLNLSANSIKILENKTFQNRKKLANLDLSRNKIQHIEEGVFDNLIRLMNLYLGNNRISRIGKELFTKCPKLHILFLNDNLLENFEPGTFTSTTVEYLNFDNNKLRRVEERIFSNNTRTKTISFRENGMVTIEPDAFRNVTSLANIDLDGNQLTHLDNRTFLGLQELFILRLSRNLFESIPDGIFGGLNMLTILVIHGNQLSTVPRLGDIPLQQMFFSSNRITSLENLKFLTNISLLSNVFLDNNRIERIFNNTFKGATKLNAISLTGNPLTVIEDGAFLSLQSLKIINLLDTQLTIPLNIWPTKALITYIVLQSKESTTDIVIRGQNTDSKAVLKTLGYICRDVAFDKYDCEPCNRGSFKSPSRQSCELCPPGGFYQDEMGYSAIIVYNLGCKQCPPGSYVKPDLAPGKSQIDCQSCPPGTNLREYAKFRACRCMENYYRLDRFGPCSICTKGYVCLNESIDLAPGFFWVWQSKKSQEQYEAFKNELMITNIKYKIKTFEGNIPNAYACPVAESCLGKRYSKCSKGNEGPLCAVCGKGYFNVLTKCRECPTLPWIIGQIVMASLAMAVLVVIVLWEKKKDPNNPSRSLADIFLARLKIVIGFYQVSVATFDSFSYISWPGTVVTIMKYAKMVQFNLLLIAPVHCINYSIRADAYTQLLLSVTVTAIVILVGPVFNFLMKGYVKYKTKGKENQDIQISQYKEKSYRLLILILFITFPSTCNHIIQMLPAACQEICSYGNVQCNSYLKADYSIKCNTAKHSIYGSFGSASLIYCIGFPLSMFALLKYARRSIRVDKEKKSVILAGTRFLYENYSEECWYWEIVELVRKIVVTSMLILMNAESRTSLGFTAILSGLYSVGFAYSKPIDDAFEHWLQLVSLMASSVNFTVGMLMKIPAEESSSGINNQTDTFIVTAFLVGANVLVIALVAVKYISNVMTTALALKKNPECSVTCCLEILQLAADAPGEVSNMSAPQPPAESQDLFQNVAEGKGKISLDNGKHESVKNVRTKDGENMKMFSKRISKDVKDVTKNI